MNNTLNRLLGGVVLTLAAIALPFQAQADEHEAAEGEATNVRAMAISVEAVVTDIDLETRQVTLKGPAGESFTVAASEDVVKLENVSVGDTLRATYLAALEGCLLYTSDAADD